jgi:hypothetical protein
MRQNGNVRMTDLKRVNLQASKIHRAPARTGRKIAICSLAVLIAATMAVWFAFLGWGIVEIFRSIVIALKGLWTTFT